MSHTVSREILHESHPITLQLHLTQHYCIIGRLRRQQHPIGATRTFRNACYVNTARAACILSTSSSFRMSSFDDSGSEASLDPCEVFRDDVNSHINSIRSSGSFATSGIIRNLVLPGLSVDPTHQIGCPLSAEGALAIKRVGRLASFGIGTETVLDVTVRSTWEVDAENIRFLNPYWQDHIATIVVEVSRELGIEDTQPNIHAKFYKMLLYEQGSMFKAHQE